MEMKATLLVTILGIVTVGQPSQAQLVPEYFGRSTSCATQCEQPTAFQYTNNMVHVFDYHASAKFLSGSREPQLGVTARAHITIAGPCEMILALSHVRLADSSDPSPKFSAALVDNPLRFGFDDGRITAVCPAKDEPLWVLNFKRALLSTFQNSMKDFERLRPVITEDVDVTGTCVSNYTAVIDPSGVVNVTRARPSSCTSPPLPPSPSPATTLLRLLPLFEREQKCLQTISGGALKDAICRENIRYPSLFGGDVDFPIASLTTRLKLSYQFKADFVVVPNFEARRSTLAMEWESGEPGEPSPEWLSIASGIISQLTNYGADPVAFYRLTEVLKTLDYDKFNDLFINIDPETWDVATMAFLRLGTDPSVKLLKDFLDSRDLSSSAYIDVINYLLKNTDLTSNLINILLKQSSDNFHYYYHNNDFVMRTLKKYCEINPQCEDDDELSNLLAYFIGQQKPPNCTAVEKPVSNGDDLELFSSSSYSQTKTGFRPKNVRILENFASLGKWNHTFDNALLQCTRSEHQKEWYGALEALRSVPCSDLENSTLLPLFEQNPDDSYRQIMIYRTLVRCPNDDFKAYVLDRLAQDKVDQVTSYIWTHLSNLKSEGWATEMVKSSSLTSKYREQGLKFSRNFKKNFVLAKKTYTIECNVIFSGFSLKPQYVSLQIYCDDSTPREIIGIEIREVNQTVSKSNAHYDLHSHYDSGSTISDGSEPEFVTESSCLTIVRVMGNQIYSREKDYKSTIGSASHYLFGTAVEFGTRMMDFFSQSFFARFFSRHSFDVQYYKAMDIDIFFPTSIGLPFHLMVNGTKGYHSTNAIASSAKQIEGAMYIDAHYTNVGSKLITRFDVLPFLNLSKHLDRFQVLIEMSEIKTTLANVELGVYNMENDKLTPRFFKNESQLESLCIPGLKEMFGSTICFEYCPKSSWWPIYNLKYNLIYEKQEGIQGHNISVRGHKDSIDWAYEVIGSEDRSWRIVVYQLAQFLNIDLKTPFFALRGSGTFKPKVLNLEEPGQAINISGILRCDSDAAPFILTGATEMKEGEGLNMNVNFESRIFESKILAAVKLGDNTSVTASVPYKLKDRQAETIDIAVDVTDFEFVYDTRNTVPSSKPSNFSRETFTALVTFSEFPQSKIDVKAAYENDDGVDDLDTYSVNLTLACGDKSLTSAVSAIWSRDILDTNSSHVYKEPDHVVSIKKNVYKTDELCRAQTVIECNDKLVFEGEGEYGVTKEHGVYSNVSIVVPRREPDAQFPLFQITFDQNFNFLNQHYHIYCRKSYEDRSLLLNFTSDVMLDKNGVPQGYDQNSKHKASLEISSSSFNPFLVSADSQLSNSLEDLDLSVDVQTPFSRWDKEAFKLKLKKKGSHLQTTLIENHRNEEATIYELEGSLDHNIIEEVFDLTKKKRRS
ncbi:Lipid transport protein N-terminal [Trinorchestia longiramus]|nr:Lipid transport protein N-terminal [Trinorchestia longiramus]